MRTVKEVSDITGISVRTLHYYDEIGLLKPSAKSEAGYRLYDDKALETLKQVLFFREFGIPLKDIKYMIDDPAVDKAQILRLHRKMLLAEKERIERLVSGIDDFLKGENKMDFTVFSKTELEEIFQTMLDNMPEDIKALSIKEFGSIEQWKEHYIKVSSSEKMQKGYAEVVKWYGGKEKYLSVMNDPVSSEYAEDCNRQIDKILYELASKKGCAVDSDEVKELVLQYAAKIKEFSRIEQEEGLMLATAQSYNNDLIKKKTDEKYGEGASVFFARAIEGFYKGI